MPRLGSRRHQPFSPLLNQTNEIYTVTYAFRGVFDGNRREKARANRHLFFFGVSQLVTSDLDEEAVQRGAVAVRLVELQAIDGSRLDSRALAHLGCLESTANTLFSTNH